MLRSTLSSLAIMVSAIAFGVCLGFIFFPQKPDKPETVSHSIISHPVRSSSHAKSNIRSTERARLIDRIKKASVEPEGLVDEYKLPPKSDIYVPPDHHFPAQRYPNNVTKPLTKLVAFTSSPFPYKGRLPNSSTPFLNYKKEGKLAHKTNAGRVYWAEETYNDNRVLLHVPKGFDAEQPGVIVLFFHGHGATLKRDVIARQKVPIQISKAGVNAVLVAPQFAKDARDSSAGKFWKRGGARRFLKETSKKLAEIYGDEKAAKKFNNMPVIIVGYSGGYSPTAWCLANGGIRKRVKGVFLLDGLYGHLNTFANWIAGNRNAVFMSAHTKLTNWRNVKLREILKKRKIPYKQDIQGAFRRGDIVFLRSDEKHHHYVTRAWVPYPIRDILLRMSGVIPGIQRIHTASF